MGLKAQPKTMWEDSPQQSDILFCIHRGRHVICDVARGATVHGIIINENYWDV